ncbi:hypothetical protein O3P69_014181 [Scylla paramamosain]|uniref:Uncharacterized protein n=1 Tax=Scylla paramamosain TaxID=85552 RepID=A0AAW0SEB4_SCYPA
MDTEVIKVLLDSQEKTFHTAMDFVVDQFKEEALAVKVSRPVKQWVTSREQCTRRVKQVVVNHPLVLKVEIIMPRLVALWDTSRKQWSRQMKQMVVNHRLVVKVGVLVVPTLLTLDPLVSVVVVGPAMAAPHPRVLVVVMGLQMQPRHSDSSRLHVPEIAGSQFLLMTMTT